MIEQVWSEMKRYVRRLYCENPQVLRDRIFRFFANKMTLEKCRAYVGHLPKVLDKIIEAGGEWTDM